MISIGLLDFILLALATFRLTHLFVFDEITTFIRKPFHEIVEEIQADGTVVQYVNVKGKGIKKFIGDLLSCYWCTGIWASAFLFTGHMLYPVVFIWVIGILAIAGVAAIIEAVVQRI